MFHCFTSFLKFSSRLILHCFMVSVGNCGWLVRCIWRVWSRSTEWGLLFRCHGVYRGRSTAHRPDPPALAGDPARGGKYPWLTTVFSPGVYVVANAFILLWLQKCVEFGEFLRSSTYVTNCVSAVLLEERGYLNNPMVFRLFSLLVPKVSCPQLMVIY